MTSARQLNREGEKKGVHTKRLKTTRNMFASNKPEEKVHQFTELS